jgi:hypothetical protein
MIVALQQIAVAIDLDEASSRVDELQGNSR